jgi:hypothetical protein
VRFDGKPFKELYQSTMDRFEAIVGLGYEIRYIWECDFKACQRKTCPASVLGVVRTYIAGSVSAAK